MGHGKNTRFNGIEKIDQQIMVWSELAFEACLQRRFIRALKYYEMALNDARRHRFKHHQAQLCRDMAYVFLHHGSLAKTHELLDEGLAQTDIDPGVRMGLYSNKVSAYLLGHRFTEALATLDLASDYFLNLYPDVEDAPPVLMVSFAGLQSLRSRVKHVVDILRTGVDPSRVQIDFHLAPPPWA